MWKGMNHIRGRSLRLVFVTEKGTMIMARVCRKRDGAMQPDISLVTDASVEHVTTIRTRPSLSLVRLFSAQCAVCDGIGCTECAFLGLR